jgi:hypothetical protein
MSNRELPDCAKCCAAAEQTCTETGCRMWINFEEDNNCSLISIYRNGEMTLSEISKRLGISLVRVSQIEKLAVKKLSKRIKI